MTIPRNEHTMTKLPNGNILVTGGYGSIIDNNAPYPVREIVKSCEIYDPLKNKWEEASNMLTTRIQHTVTLLNTNKLVVVGGQPSNQKVELSKVVN